MTVAAEGETSEPHHPPITGWRRNRATRRRRPPEVLSLVFDALRGHPAQSAVLTVSLALAGAAPVGIAAASGHLLAGAARLLGSRRPGDTGHVYVLAGLVAGLLLVGQVALGIRTHLGGVVGRRLSGEMLRRAMDAVSARPTTERLLDSDYAATVARVRGLGSLEVLPGDGFTALVSLGSTWSGNLAAAGLLAGIRWWVGLGAAAVLSASYLAIRRGYRAIVLGSQDEAGALARAAYLRDVLVTPGAAKEVRLFGLSDYFIGGFRSAWTETTRHLRAARAADEWVSYVLCLGVAAVYLGTLGILGVAVARGRLGAGDLAAAALALGPLTAGVLPGRDDLNIGWGAASAGAVRRLEAEPTDGSSPPRSVGAGGAVSLSCRRLSFAYPGTSVFDSLDLDLEPGRSVALVGENGAGKTTLTSLLSGLLAPQRGQLLIDGRELDDASRVEWQRQVAVLFQDFVHYEATTLYDNVGYGSVGHLDDRAGVIRAGARAGLDDVVSALPGGWDSLLGPAHPGGTDLSGGQWQRVGLARALFALDHGARLLILDEPAANLDVTAETELYDRFLAMTAGVTTVIVSHRLAAVRHADRIVVLEGGRVVEDGSHDQLMARGGGYAEMFNLQASRFRSQP